MNLTSAYRHYRLRVSPHLLCFLAALSILPLTPCYAVTWLVGPEYSLKLPSQAAQQAHDGDIVLIAAGSYAGDVASWPQNRLILRGIGGRAHLIANG